MNCIELQFFKAYPCLWSRTFCFIVNGLAYMGRFSRYYPYGLTNPNASPIETHVNCLKSTSRYNIIVIGNMDCTWTLLTLNPLGSHDASKHHFTSLKTDLIFLQPRVLEQKFPWNWFTSMWQFSLIFHPPQAFFIHYDNCDSNSRLVVDEDGNGKCRLVRVNALKYVYTMSNLALVASLEYQCYGSMTNINILNCQRRDRH